MPETAYRADSLNLWSILFLLVVTCIALAPRAWNLNEVGFQKDEEYTAWASNAYLDNGSLALPSGLEYRRAVPLTLATALSIDMFGKDSEAHYRIPPVVLGVLTPALLFLMLRGIAGNAVAAVAALLLALSEWHILLSREARMYAPFLLFYLAASVYLWRWASDGRLAHLASGTILFLIAASLQKLALLALLAPVVPMLVRERTAVPFYKVAIFVALAGGLVMLYSKLFIMPPYNTFKETLKVAGEGPPSIGMRLEALWVQVTTFYHLYLLAAVGAINGYWLARARLKGAVPGGNFLRKAFYYLSALLAGVCVFTGQIYAATLMVFVFFLACPELPTPASRTVRLPLLALLLASVIWLVLGVWLHGVHDAFKYAALFPFPYLAYYGFIAPGALALFLGSGLWMIFRPQEGSDWMRACLIYALVPIVFIGAVSHWGGARYLVGAYPFMLIAAAAGLVRLIEVLGRKSARWNEARTTAVALAAVVFSLFPGNNIPDALRAATMTYGEPDYWQALVFPQHPDHKGAGEYVRQHLRDGDIVIAEDVSQQLWYAGQADYWLRSRRDGGFFLYKDTDGTLRDIYAGSTWLSGERLKTLHGSSARRLWVITSAETAGSRERFLDPDQRAWLMEIEANVEPVYNGRDNVTKVYCLGCT